MEYKEMFSKAEKSVLKDNQKSSEHMLSFQQESVFVDYQLNPNGTEYILPSLIKLEGNVDEDLIKKSYIHVVNRHSSLRTNFLLNEEGNISRKISDFYKFKIMDQVFSCEEKLIKYLSTEAKKRYDLEKDALVQGGIYKVNDIRYLFIRFHHLIVDGSGQGVFFEELSNCYSAYCSGHSPGLSTHYNYNDYVTEQKESSDDQLKNNLSYWKTEIGNIPLLTLPTETTPQKKEKIAEEVICLKDELLEKIRSTKSKENVTTFKLLLTAYLVLLYKYSSSNDVVIGVPSHGRNKKIEQIIGYFTNVLPIKASFKKDTSLRCILKQVENSISNGILHQDISPSVLFENISSGLKGSRIFQTSFNNYPYPEGKFNIKDVKVTNLSGMLGIFNALYDVGLCFRREPDNVIIVRYNSNLFKKETIERLRSHYLNILDLILTNLEIKITDVDFLTLEEKKIMLTDWNRTEINLSKNLCIHHLFENQVQQIPDQLALVANRNKLTYKDLDENANKLANAILSISPECKLIPICCERSVNYIVAILGILKAGYGYIPLDSKIPKKRIDTIIKDSNSTLLVSDLTISHINAQSIIDINLVLSDSKGSGKSPDIEISTKNIAYTIYTSGSTGRPKGVIISHKAIVNYTTAVCDSLNLPAKSKYAHIGTLTADLGLTMLFPAFAKGSTLHLIDNELFLDPEKLSQYIKLEKIDCLKITPGHFSSLLSCEKPQYVIPAKILIFGGESLPISLVKKVKKLSDKVKVFNHYGPSESTVGVLAWEIEDTDSIPGTIVPLGYPLNNTKVYILSVDNNPVPIGIPGELAISGVGLSEGYLNRADLTDENFVHNPFESNAPYDRIYKTGDIVRRLSNGNIEFLGRKDFQVKIRGYRVELEEIAMTINEIPEIDNSIVIAKNDKLFGYFTASKKNIDKDIVFLFLKKKLPYYMIPNQLIQIKSFLLTPNGKVDRKALPKPDKLVDQKTIIEPSTDIEKRLAEIFTNILMLEKIGIHDDFFESGGNSLSAIRLVTGIRKEFQKEVPLADLFSNATIEGISKCLFKNSDGFEKEELHTFGEFKTHRNQGSLLKRFLRFFAFKNKKFIWLYKKFCRPSGLDWAELLNHHDPFYSMGVNCVIGSDVVITDHYLVRLGNNVRLTGCKLFGHDGSANLINSISGSRLDAVGKIDIGDNVMIGNGAIVTRGVTIGSNTIISAGSVVTQDIPTKSIASGNPAQVIGTFDDYIELLRFQNKSWPWMDLIKKRDSSFDPLLEPELRRLRTEYFFENEM